MNIYQQKKQQVSSSISSSSTLPIIYFTPIILVKIKSSEFNLANIKRYRIHTIKLPILSSLTHLSTNCLNMDGDKYMFGTIH